MLLSSAWNISDFIVIYPHNHIHIMICRISCKPCKQYKAGKYSIIKNSLERIDRGIMLSQGCEMQMWNLTMCGAATPLPSMNYSINKHNLTVKLLIHNSRSEIINIKKDYFCSIVLVPYHLILINHIQYCLLLFTYLLESNTFGAREALRITQSTIPPLCSYGDWE